MPKHNYPEFIAQKIGNFIHKNPGHTGREIAIALGLIKEEVNSWLYTRSVQQKYKLEVRNYRWYSCRMESPQAPLQPHPLPAASQHKSFSQKRKTVDEWKERIRTYTTEKIRKTFSNPKYNSTPNEFKVALWEVLQEREEDHKKPNSQSTVDNWKKEVKKYSPEAVESAFSNSNYNKLIDDQKAALAEVLEENKSTQVTKNHSRDFSLAKRGGVWTLILAGVLFVGFLWVNQFLSTIKNNQPPTPSQGNPSQQILP